MDKYYIKKTPKMTALHNIESWSKLDTYLAKHKSASLNDLVMIVSTHNHEYGGNGFIKYCIDNGWLSQVK